MVVVHKGFLASASRPDLISDVRAQRRLSGRLVWSLPVLSVSDTHTRQSWYYLTDKGWKTFRGSSETRQSRVLAWSYRFAKSCTMVPPFCSPQVRPKIRSTHRGYDGMWLALTRCQGKGKGGLPRCIIHSAGWKKVQLSTKEKTTQSYRRWRSHCLMLHHSGFRMPCAHSRGAYKTLTRVCDQTMQPNGRQSH